MQHPLRFQSCLAPIAGAAVIAVASLSSSAMATVVTVPASAWVDGSTFGTGATASVNGYSASLTTLLNGWAQNSPYSGDFAGVWIGAGTANTGLYDLAFGGQRVTSVSMYFTAASGSVNSGWSESFFQWSALGGSANSVSVTDVVDMNVSGAGSLGTLNVTATSTASDGRFRLTITSTGGFTELVFRHAQNPGMNGSVLNGLTFEVATAPAPGGLALLVSGGLFARRRRR